MTEQADFDAVPPVTLGWRIQLALDHGGLKHKDLMETFEVSRETVSRWCRDVGTPPKKFILRQIAMMCGVSSKWLIDGTPGLMPPPGAPNTSSPSRIVEIPTRARVLVVDDDGTVNEDAMRMLAPLAQRIPVTLRLTAERSARLSYRGLSADSSVLAAAA